jgi:hypothetical protein
MGNFLNPLQLGFGTKYGAEAEAHSTRNYLSYFKVFLNSILCYEEQK